MSGDEEARYEDVRGDGSIVLYRRGGKSGIYHVRLKIPGAKNHKRLSTRKSDRSEAIRVAQELYDENSYQFRATGSIDSKTYRDVFTEWEKSRLHYHRSNDERDRTVEYTKTYSLEYFGGKKIDQITTAEFHRYWDWRRQNFKRKKPTNDTLNRERAAIKSLMKYAFDRGYISKPLEIEKLKTRGIRRRSTFSDDEWTRIYTGMREWVKEGKANGHWRQRYLLQQYVLLMSNSGIRIGEMREATWGDVSKFQGDEESQIIIKVDGKTGMREVILNPDSELYLKRLYDLRRSELNGADPKSQENIFLNLKTGKPIQSFKVGFNSILNYCNVPIMADGMNRTIYSLRHFYATKRILGKASLLDTAKNMGTSVSMLENHYGHLTTKDRVSRLRASTNQTEGSKSEGLYPFW